MANRHTGSAVPQESMWQRGAVPRLSYVSWIDRCAFYEVPAAQQSLETGTASVLPPLAARVPGHRRPARILNINHHLPLETINN